MTSLLATQTQRLKSVLVHGTLNNLFFAAGGSGLVYLQAIIVMRIVGPRQIGLFAIASAISLSMEYLSDFGIGDRIVQQSNEKLKETYSLAVAMHFALAVVLCLFMVGGSFFAVRIYGLPELGPLIRGLSYSAFTGFARLPLFLLYRELRYFEQRLLLFLGRCAGFVVTVGCALAGFGVKSLVVGGLVTLIVSGIPAWFIAPLRPTLRFQIQDTWPMIRFSTPIWFSKLTYVLVLQGSVIVASVALPLSGLGQFKSSEQLSSLISYTEVVLGQTLYPILCKLKDSPAQLAAVFTKACRVSMFWIAGGAMTLVLFSHDIVNIVLSKKWEGAEPYLFAQGIALLFGGWLANWDVLFKARNDTRPIFTMSIIFAGIFLVCFVPPALLWKERGVVAGVILANAALLVSRAYYVKKLGLGISLLEISSRSLISALASAALVWSLHWAFPSLAFPIRFLAYLVCYTGSLLWLERNLVRQMLQVLLHRGSAKDRKGDYESIARA